VCVYVCVCVCVYVCVGVQCLCMVVDAACRKKCESFQVLLDNLMVMLHTHVRKMGMGVVLARMRCDFCLFC